MTAMADARRCGFAATGPPSWKISSTEIWYFLTFSSCMNFYPRCLVFACAGMANAMRLAIEMECCGDDEPLLEERARSLAAIAKRLIDLIPPQRPDAARHFPCAQIIVGLDFAGREASDRRVSRQVDIIGDDGRGGISAAGAFSQYGDCIGDAERKASAAPAAGGDAADLVLFLDFGIAKQRWLVRPVDQADLERGAGRQVKRDVAAI